MARRETYLVALDAEDEVAPAIERAAWLAARTGARLALWLPQYSHAIDREPELRDKQLAHNRARLEDAAERLARRGLGAEIDVRWERFTHAALIEKAADAAATLVFKDTRYHSALRRALFSSVEWDLIRHCPMPLWLVKDRPLSDPPRLLAAVDPSREHGKPSTLDRQILATAKGLREATAGELDVVHVIAPIRATLAPPAAGAPASAGVVATERGPTPEEERRRRTALNGLLDEAGIDRHTLKVERGLPPHELVRIATDREADVVVMGAVPRNPIRAAFIGNTAEAVLDRLPCDLLVVKDPAAEPP
jgi:universal stress protein E